MERAMCVRGGLSHHDKAPLQASSIRGVLLTCMVNSWQGTWHGTSSVDTLRICHAPGIPCTRAGSPVGLPSAALSPILGGHACPADKRRHASTTQGHCHDTRSTDYGESCAGSGE